MRAINFIECLRIDIIKSSFMMKSIILVAVIALVASIPYEDQITLANSLIVGRDDYSDLYNWQCKVCDSSNKPIHTHPIQEKAKDVKCIISVYSKFIVLAFRYTNTAQNVWQDILYPIQIVDQGTCSNCKVQKAYHTMWQTIKLDVLADLKEMRGATGIETLYITGISLGGGLSVISYIDINKANIFKEVKITTYGAPRVGNKQWAEHVDTISGKKARRFYIKDDEVVVLPRCLTLLCTYRHTGVGIICTKEDSICQSETAQPQANPKESIFSAKKQLSALNYAKKDVGNIVDHINNYPQLYNYTLRV